MAPPVAAAPMLESPAQSPHLRTAAMQRRSGLDAAPSSAMQDCFSCHGASAMGTARVAALACSFSEVGRPAWPPSVSFTSMPGENGLAEWEAASVTAIYRSSVEPSADASIPGAAAERVAPFIARAGPAVEMRPAPTFAAALCGTDGRPPMRGAVESQAPFLHPASHVRQRFESSPLALQSHQIQPEAAVIAAEVDKPRRERLVTGVATAPRANHEPPRHPRRAPGAVEEVASPLGRLAEAAQRTQARAPEMQPGKPPFAGTCYDMAGRVTLGTQWLPPRCVAPQSRCEAAQRPVFPRFRSAGVATVCTRLPR